MNDKRETGMVVDEGAKVSYQSVLNRILNKNTPASGLSRDDLWRRVHNMWDGKSCYACGRNARMTPSIFLSVCQYCSAPNQNKCSYWWMDDGERRMCQRFTDPVRSGDHWVDSLPYCDDHMGVKKAETRDGLLDALPPAILGDCMDYHKGPGRTGFVRKLKSWVDGDTHCPNLFIYGPHGVGKTVSAARAAYNLVTKGAVQGFMWYTEHQLIELCRNRNPKDSREQDGFKAAAKVELLVVDEMFRSTPQGMYPSDRDAMKDFFYRRLEDLGKRTIMTSNVPGEEGFDTHYNSAVQSRFAGSTQSVLLEGKNYREKIAGQAPIFGGE